jgi:hypothetical protein
LTTAHFDQDKKNNSYHPDDCNDPSNNLFHWCQKCHLKHDRNQHNYNRKYGRKWKENQVVMDFEAPADTEEVVSFQDLPKESQKAVCGAHADALNLGKKESATLQRIFKLGNPNIVIGPDANAPTYFRIAEESVDVMKVITREYLHI